MNNLIGKRLMVLGGTISTYDVIKTAKEMGVYVLAVDYLATGIAKEIADETAQVSTTDFDKLEELVKNKKIDGVFTGASEFNIRNMIQLCNRCHLPVYATLEQWDLFSNKQKFKDTCRKFDIPVVPEYSMEKKQEIQYPVIVKPVDSFSGHGIHICNNEEELIQAAEDAKKWSKSRRSIIEKYVQGDNVEVYYLVQDGNIILLTASDRYTNKNQNGSPVPTAFYHPSKHLREYLGEIHSKVCNMFKTLDVKNGVFFMESFVDKGEIMFYEMGFRLNATMEYHFVEYFNKFSPLKMMIRYALTENMGDDVRHLNNPEFRGKGCEIALLLRTGRIDKITGMDEIQNLPFVLHIIQFYHVGDTIERTGSLDQHFARIKVVADNEMSLNERIETIYNKISVCDKNGKEMIIRERK